MANSYVKMNWDNEKVLLFIREYEKRPVLWNKLDEFYFSMSKKEDAWREISMILDEDPDTLKKKMESLRGSRRREKHRYLQSLKSGRPHRDIYVSRWFAWESMKFLDDPDESQAISSNGPKKEVDDYDVETSDRNNGTRSEEDFERTSELSNVDGVAAGEDEEEADSDADKSHRIEQVYSTTEKSEGATSQFWSRRRTSRKRVTQDTRVEKGFRVLRGGRTGEKEARDDSALFAEFIAEKLRKFDSRQRAILQHEIHSLVFQAEIEAPVP